MNNYISAEEFLKQSDKVQEELWEWWIPKVLDLVSTKCEDINSCISYMYKYSDWIQLIYEEDNEPVIENYHKYELIPLLQMHQLIKFIEDKTNLHLELSTDSDKTGFWVADFYKNNKSVRAGRNLIKTNCEDRLQALWKVAIILIEG